MPPLKQYDVIIIGAGASGLMCAIEAGKRGRSVLVIEHTGKIAEKIRISGGGRCNFTNLYTSNDNFISENAHFFKSALKRYTQYDFIDYVKSHKIEYHEKTLGQLFCNQSAQNIIDALVKDCKKNNVEIILNCSVSKISKNDDQFIVDCQTHQYSCQSVVIASGGLSIPKIGASNFGYKIAKQFDIDVTELSPALVPLTFQEPWLEVFKSLSGLAINAIVSFGKKAFQEGLLFTHRGLSGPSILQISSYWQEGFPININFLPDLSINDYLMRQRENNPKMLLETILSQILPHRFVLHFIKKEVLQNKIAQISNSQVNEISNLIHQFQVKPSGSEGYRTAEVTLGGVDTNEISSKTFESKKVKNLYFIGEVLDVTGHLGGFNFQWAWSSGYCCGQYC